MGALVLTCAVPSRADVVVDPASSFSIDFEPHAERVCVLFPSERTNAADCDPTDLTAVDALAHKPLYAARVKYASWSFLVVFGRTPREEIGEGNLDAYASKLRRGFANRNLELIEPLSAPQLTHVNGAEVVQVDTGARLGDGSEQWMSIYALTGADASYTIFTATDSSAHADEVGKTMQATLGTLKIRVPDAPTAVDRAAKTGDSVGYALEAFAGAVAVVFLVWFALRKKRDDGRAAPDPKWKRDKKKRKVVSWDRDRDGP